MAAEQIRIGVIGANIHRGWAPRSHLPALVASPEFELTAVCTTRKETAEESAQRFGARLAFDDYREMLACPDIDAVAVVLRVPSHYQVTIDAIRAGKHVFTEWPLGKTLAEAEDMAEQARRQNVQHMVGLQARVNPAIMYMKGLVETGYVGEVMSCHVSVMRGGGLQRPSDRTWQRDDSLGANTLTIPFGHTVDAFRYVVGDFSHVASVVSTQATQWLATDTQQWVDVTAPDNVLVSGRLVNGGVASVHVAANPWPGSGFRMEIYGREGSLVASGANSPQLVEVRLQGLKAGENQLQDIPIPARYTLVSEGMPKGEAYHIGQMYVLFARAIRSAQPCEPNFHTAVRLHRLIDTVRAASQQGRELAVPTDEG
jgi:predicted dehydrogenase